MYSVYLLSGSNLGDRAAQLNQCIVALEELAGTITQTSLVYETEAWGLEGLPAHLNQAIHLNTKLEPLQLLDVIHAIEHKLGRVRQQKWGVRAIDIDIIYFDNQVLQLPELTIPHSLMQERNFVLTPLAEIAPDFVHPVFHKTNRELLSSSSDYLSAVPI